MFWQRLRQRCLFDDRRRFGPGRRPRRCIEFAVHSRRLHGRRRRQHDRRIRSRLRTLAPPQHAVETLRGLKAVEVRLRQLKFRVDRQRAPERIHRLTPLA